MCIIIAKRAGLDLPAREILERCFNNNPDGAGIAYSEYEEVKILKGFMAFDEFEKGLKSIQHQKSRDMLFHFRISTAGGISEYLTHPYPLCSDIDKMLLLSDTVGAAVMHNGIIPGMYPSKGVNDTMLYIKEVMFPLSKLHSRYYEDARGVSILENTSHSKLAILDANGIHLIGKFIEEAGLFYSNDGYLREKVKWSSYAYDYDDGMGAERSWLSRSKGEKTVKTTSVGTKTKTTEISYLPGARVIVTSFGINPTNLVDINGHTVKGYKKLYQDIDGKLYFWNLDKGGLQDIETVPWYYMRIPPNYRSKDAMSIILAQ